MIPLNNNNTDDDINAPSQQRLANARNQKSTRVRIHMICEEAESLSDADCAVAKMEIVRQLSYQRLEVGISGLASSCFP
jgi:hypothetical protein